MPPNVWMDLIPFRSIEFMASLGNNNEKNIVWVNELELYVRGMKPKTSNWGLSPFFQTIQITFLWYFISIQKKFLFLSFQGLTCSWSFFPFSKALLKVFFSIHWIGFFKRFLNPSRKIAPQWMIDPKTCKQETYWPTSCLWNNNRMKKILCFGFQVVCCEDEETFFFAVSTGCKKE